MSESASANAQPEKIDWLIRGGRVIDPSQEFDRVADVAIREQRIVGISDQFHPDQAEQTFDARGLIITPGLIDLHIHGYQHVTPLGIDVDHYCLGRGVTTAVDAGSAGCDTFPGFREYAVARSRTRLLAFLHISRAGLAFATRTGSDDPGELETLKLIHTEDCIACLEANRDVLVGVKIRLSSSIANQGANEAESYRRAQAAAAAASLPLMTHHNFSSVSLEDCPGKLRSGDIYTHCFHGYPSTILQAENRQLEGAVLAARDRGVLMDIGHGMGSFSWPVAEAAISQGFLPDTISTDIHQLNLEGPVYDLPTCMSRLLQAGMSLDQVIAAVTSAPARAIGWEDRIGTLRPGAEADITALALEDSALELEDCHAQLRTLHQVFEPRAVWRAGQSAAITHPQQRPNPATYDTAIAWRDKLVIRD